MASAIVRVTAVASVSSSTSASEFATANGLSRACQSASAA